MKPARVYHFSEDPDIRHFEPHVPATNPGIEPLVWAIDAEHAPLYWFPRDCPRVTFLAGPDTPAEVAARFLGYGVARRVHTIECVWQRRMQPVCVLDAHCGWNRKDERQRNSKKPRYPQHSPNG